MDLGTHSIATPNLARCSRNERSLAQERVIQQTWTVHLTTPRSAYNDGPFGLVLHTLRSTTITWGLYSTHTLCSGVIQTIERGHLGLGSGALASHPLPTYTALASQLTTRN